MRSSETVCAWSNEVTLGNEWVSITNYLGRGHVMSVTHGISPKALARMEAEFGRRQPPPQRALVQMVDRSTAPHSLFGLVPTGQSFLDH